MDKDKDLKPRTSDASKLITHTLGDHVMREILSKRFLFEISLSQKQLCVKIYLHIIVV